MKKEIVVLLVLGVFLVGLSTASTPLKQHMSPIRQIQEVPRGEISFSPTDYPGWADGGFVGAWGKGEGNILGCVKGVYGHKGRVHIFMGTWNTSDASKTGVVGGIFGKGYMFGKIDLKSGKTTTPLVGLYKATDTKFVARVMGIKGDPLVVAGYFKPFQ